MKQLVIVDNLPGRATAYNIFTVKVYKEYGIFQLFKSSDFFDKKFHKNVNNAPIQKTSIKYTFQSL